MVIQELEQVVTLLLLEANDVSRELRVYIKCFLTSRRMRSYERMDLELTVSIPYLLLSGIDFPSL